jgi:FtsH-binding integral membrane protein
MTLASMFSEVYFQFQATHHWVMYVCLGISVLTFAMGIWLKYTRVPPFNYLNLLLFTVSLSYVVGFICSVTDKNLVLMAALETLSKSFKLTQVLSW